ncbi:HipA domain-containing protein [Lentisphaera marina]|uniref:type II toxin-antitoxin system HipA family toxin n=1 Tax=Lentisphaera marina TaxID=1111041 RepID=UPI00236697D3|nr:HipA domain-containing protein [Lentisphaera marina]MDD7985715.1 HipA domain-containing protein [Lentisphaera marina]
MANIEKTDHAVLLEYDMDYVFEYIDNSAENRLSLSLDCSFEFYKFEDWPAFILDLMPSGNGKRFLLEKYGRGDDDFLLQVGAWNPIGNLRISGELTKDFLSSIADQQIIAFSEEDIIKKNENFLNYAKLCGVQIDGATDVQGDAPKFLVLKDFEGRFYVDSGLVPVDKIQQHYIVKFPRGKSQADFDVLKNEAAYYEVARCLGLNVGEELYFKEGALFISRFDREVKEGEVYYYGLESLYSIAGISQRGQMSDNFLFCEMIAKYSTSPSEDVLEFLKRDVLNILLGNPDNHGRNSAMIKKDGEVRLSALYDFAPMFYDPNDIFMRRSIWFGHEVSGKPSWGCIVQKLSIYVVSITDEFRGFVKALRDLMQILRASHVDEFIIERRLAIIESEMKKLEEL